MLIAEISPTSGQNGDGFCIGSVKETLLEGALESVTNCDIRKVYRVDMSGGSTILTDVTTAAKAFIANGWKPFGDTAEFSTGDGYLIACDEEVQAILYKQDNTATHNGTLKVYDSTDSLWADNLLSVTDEGDSFRQSGWKRILLPDNANRKAFKPSQFKINGEIPPSLKYFYLKLDSVTSGTPPSCSGLVMIRKTFKWADHTADRNGDLTTAPPADSHYVWPGAIMQEVFANPAFGMEAYMALASTAVWTDEHEYYAADNTWKPVSGWTNGTNDFTSGPANLGDPIQKFPIRWSTPTDWAAKTLTFELDGGTTVSKTGYHLRERILTVTSYGLHANARYRLRARQFGAANTTGIKSLTASTLRGLSFSQYGQRNTTAIEAKAYNMDTGAPSAFTIPANPEDPHLSDFTDIALPANQSWGLQIVSGGKIVSADVTER